MGKKGLIKLDCIGLPRKWREDEVIEELRKCYRYLSEDDDYKKSMRQYFEEVSDMSYSQLLVAMHRFPNVRNAWEKVKELNKIKEAAKVLNYLKAMKEWYYSNEDVLFLMEFFSLQPYFTRYKIEKMAEEHEIIREIWEELLNMQEVRMLNKMINTPGGDKKFTFVLKNMHNWKDKQEIEVDDKQIKIDIKRETVSSDSLAKDSIDVRYEEAN